MNHPRGESRLLRRLFEARCEAKGSAQSEGHGYGRGGTAESGKKRLKRRSCEQMTCSQCGPGSLVIKMQLAAARATERKASVKMAFSLRHYQRSVSVSELPVDCGAMTDDQVEE